MTIASLRNGIFFQGLDDAELHAIAQAATTNHFTEEQFLFYESDPATTFFVVLEGRVRLIQATESGRQVILGFVGPTEGVGIIAAFSHALYPLSAQADQACTALGWDSVTLMDLMERYPIIAFRTLRMLAGRFVDLQARYREMITERVEQRIARAVVRLSRQAGKKEGHGVRIDMSISRQDIADMTGTTLYTVSRTLSRWEQQGILETGREWIKILLPHQLVTIAEDLPQPFPRTSGTCLR